MISIDKVTVTKGAIFDYEEIVCKVEMDYYKIKSQLESMISRINEPKSDLRLAYKDERTGKDLIMFIKKGFLFGLMQMWILRGICESKDYDETMENDGSIEKWLGVEIE